MKKRWMLALSCALFVISVFTVPGSQSTTTHAQGGFSVAILVVDNFTGTPLTASGASATDNCAVSLEEQAFAVRDVSADPITETHGSLVYAELEELLADAGAGGFISLVEVDIQGVTTDVAATRIQTAVTNNPADFYVINMSFALIPCEYIQAFADFEGQLWAARGARDLNRYRGTFKRSVMFYDNTVFPVMSQRAQDEENLDPIQTLLIDLGAQAVAVASAGNFGLDFPFWPGAWGQVISVSASTGEGFYAPSSWDKKNNRPLLDAEVDQGKKSHISNFGEVMMPGEYTTAAGDVVSGTSFAAPRLSFAIALYLSAVGSDQCRTDEGHPALAYGDWDNLTLDEAVQEHCPDMETYLP